MEITAYLSLEEVKEALCAYLRKKGVIPANGFVYDYESNGRASDRGLSVEYRVSEEA